MNTPSPSPLPSRAGRWLPRTLGARVLLILATGLLLAHALSFALLFYERASGLAGVYTTDGTGGIALLRVHSGWRRTW